MSILQAMVLKTLFGIGETAQRFGISKDSLRRASDAGEIRTVTLGGRRLVPLAEIERIERDGFGTPRKRKRTGKKEQ
ncbi:MAG TPA: helix-turn-helix domain-containing protein [Terriglobales bacterium]|nr:helix-turn-helix domain-containing protein [Terriglobales bacterium]